MNIAHSIPSVVQSVSFSFLTAEDIRRISVKQIINPILLDDLNRPNIGGLYDPALGPSEKQDICTTCRLNYFTCPGHYGHIELPSPVFHPLFMTNMYHVLRTTCLFCHKFKVGPTTLCVYAGKLRLAEHGLLVAAKSLDDLIPQKKNKGSAQADGDEDEDGVIESSEDFAKRVNVYVDLQLARASSSKRDDYKDGLVYQARKDLIQEFIRISQLKKCMNCGAHGYTFRKEGHTKIIEYDLTRKQKEQNIASGRRRPDVLHSVYHSSNAHLKETTGDDSDVSMSDAEPAGDPTMSDEDQEMASVEDENLHQIPTGPAKAANGTIKGKRGRNERVMAPEECRAHLRRLFSNEPKMCSLIFGRHGPFSKFRPDGHATASADIFFMDAIPVSPTRFRPPAKMGDTLFEHAQNQLLTRVLNTSYKLRDLTRDLRAASVKSVQYDEATRRRILGALLDALVQLQVDVNSFLDSSKNPQPVRQGQLPPAGVKQGLEKKEGLFRQHMMGKRVNYAARSVISPDVNIEPNEIGIPPVFARKLTFPESVTPANVHEMRQLVINGARAYPGATMVEFEDGHQQSLDVMSVEARTALANQLLKPPEGERNSSKHGLYTRTTAANKKVYRHLRDGDVLILNRQPTLHKPSMMVHKARVLRGEKTIRMHYANCNSYNADFDGDEMNIHFPQNQVARAEAMMIANTDNQYLVTTSGKPLRGLIQDHVVAGVWMTSKEAFFTREEYFQLLYGALRPEEEGGHITGRLVTLPPTIWKPNALWTGKQIISTVLLNITPSNARGLNTEFKAKVPGYLWGKDSIEEDKVVFVDGELLCGVLDKSSFGASEYGMVHSVYELYSSEVAGRLLGILSRLFTKFLQHRAFTCRMDDLTLTPTGDAKRRDILQNGRNLGTEAAMENFPSLVQVPPVDKPGALESLLREVLRDDSKMAGLDVTVKTKLATLTKAIADAVMPRGLSRQFPLNHMQTMTLSGAKGSAVNAQQISCALGQQELEGRRVPVMISGKTLPSFKAFETKAIAGGYVASRFLTGIKPQEFYFHCMAGREGLIDTAVKTSRSGYLQRCLIKHLEGLKVHYDYTVRGSDDSIYQFHYGGDALDVTKQKYLYQFDFTSRNELSLINKYQPGRINRIVNDSDALEYSKKIIRKSAPKRHKYAPILSKFNPSLYLGATSERFAESVESYLKFNPHGLLKSRTTENAVELRRRHPLLTKDRFRLLMNVQYMRALVDPGEAVGLLASQGVGEPSTQMTLNTFHFAGHGAANVTLGIPRLREIVMTASKQPKTPSMIVPIRPDVGDRELETFCKQANRLSLSQVIDEITVTEKLVTNGKARRKEFNIRLAFFPREEYEREYHVSPPEILAAFGARFALILKKEILTEMKRLDADLKGLMAALGKGKAVKDTTGADAADNDDDVDEGARGGNRGEDERSEIGDGDAEDAKHERQRKEQSSYESDGGDDDLDDDVDYGAKGIAEAYANVDKEMEAEELTDAQPVVLQAKKLVNQSSAVQDEFKRTLKFAKSLKFDDSGCSLELEFEEDMPKLLLVGVVERTCAKTIVREIPGITECFKGTDAKKRAQITTNGSNFRGVWEFSALSEVSIIDHDGIYSNDIYGFLMTYGVEAARSAILREISGVFDAYKIDVDGRHLELIADYMTFDGGYKPFNRKGISTHSSPLMKASYETTAAFLSDATLYGDFDTLTSPSGNIVLGKPSTTGTGSFDVIMPVTVS
ncbi:beta and beta-prime subunits of DNA dependent RNA-polymerase [Punctularia strigosozonata HHB-11173 SS5]|uniref:beta and beta-prime subunits of DNA dependent RNA-polymerase n=1 Tax=Punctularia strigosozonata (strain HHB-11173) TaxID=741275 RepID=UPI00044164B6|nr:beta and beta-prime subunits of DNA dependent RNA-polymerase [Punctularia strigosozonata HHB-11173 SS5]EIN10866.1 beta and beta-prime subunits of DNA dependent RNA-polymerase [Punctularia strigosozonata HHB-11173 SS5]